MDNLTETGLLALAGLISAFIIKCCLTIEQSRCEKIDICGIKCHRNVLSEAHLARLQAEEKAIEESKRVDDNL